ncbi:ORF7R [Ictalurid herpesvirus 1]|nr:ORF7L [Ictalurid herpesvirus 1]QAB08568.1 ORF7R [Ictalurid herpesvirus 1]
MAGIVERALEVVAPGEARVGYPILAEVYRALTSDREMHAFYETCVVSFFALFMLIIWVLHASRHPEGSTTRGTDAHTQTEGSTTRGTDAHTQTEGSEDQGSMTPEADDLTRPPLGHDRQIPVLRRRMVLDRDLRIDYSL